MKVTSSHALMFVMPPSDAAKASLSPLFEGDTFSLKPTAVAVNVPAWVARDPHFVAARNAGWVVVDSSTEDAAAHDANVLTGATEDQIFDEFLRRLKAGGDAFEQRASKYFADRHVFDHREEPAAGEGQQQGDDSERLDPGEDDPLMKSSGQDGDAGDWTTQGRMADGYPCDKGAPEDTTATPAEKGAYTKRKNAAAAAAAAGGKSTEV